MASGKAIVCADHEVLREVLRDGRNALLYPPDDLDAWMAALEELRRSPERRAELGRNARADFLARHTWAKRAASVLPQ